MKLQLTSKYLPTHIWFLIAVYFIASLAHFAHNAEYIAFYPNMPLWITRNTVYVAWLVITSVGVAGLIALRLKWQAIGAVLIAIYGAFGLDGLLHYTLALCSQHTLLTNITIWSEAVSGLGLLLASSCWCESARRQQASLGSRTSI
ncbi:MAG TPA: hypothetical protein VHL14_05905 [Steroidobacteraceae bacterium]|jgi:hypothetical protein|nr:hypothetical protein [Steroidobacteraceae bacterium]